MATSQNSQLLYFSAQYLIFICTSNRKLSTSGNLSILMFVVLVFHCCVKKFGEVGFMIYFIFVETFVL